MTDLLLQQLQQLSDTPLRVLSAKPGRLTAIGQVTAGVPQLAQRIADRGLGELADSDPHGSLYRLDELGVIASCTWFGSLMLMQVPDPARFIESYLRGNS